MGRRAASYPQAAHAAGGRQGDRAVSRDGAGRAAPAERSRPVWLAGGVRRRAMVPADERAFRYGDGTFVTLRAERGRLLDAAAHLERLSFACGVLGLEPPPEAALDRLLDILPRLGAGGRAASVVRVQASAGPSARSYARPSGTRSWALVEVFPPPSPRRLVVVTAPPDLRLPPPAVPGVKSCSALPAVLAARAAERLGAHEVLRVEGGRLTEAAAANLFWIRDGVLRTPAASLPLYPGVTRSVVLEAARGIGLAVEEGRFPPDALEEAEAVFLTNAVRGVERIRRLDGREPGWPETARALARAAAQLRRERGAALGPPRRR